MYEIGIVKHNLIAIAVYYGDVEPINSAMWTETKIDTGRKIIGWEIPKIIFF